MKQFEDLPASSLFHSCLSFFHSSWRILQPPTLGLSSPPLTSMLLLSGTSIIHHPSSIHHSLIILYQARGKCWRMQRILGFPLFHGTTSTTIIYLIYSFGGVDFVACCCWTSQHLQQHCTHCCSHPTATSIQNSGLPEERISIMEGAADNTLVPAPSSKICPPPPCGWCFKSKSILE